MVGGGANVVDSCTSDREARYDERTSKTSLVTRRSAIKRHIVASRHHVLVLLTTDTIGRVAPTTAAPHSPMDKRPSGCFAPPAGVRSIAISVSVCPL